QEKERVELSQTLFMERMSQVASTNPPPLLATGRFCENTQNAQTPMLGACQRSWQIDGQSCTQGQCQTVTVPVRPPPHLPQVSLSQKENGLQLAVGGCSWQPRW